MQKLGDVRRALEHGELDSSLSRLLWGDSTAARRRISDLLNGFQHSFGGGEDRLVALCSAPGRTEICGNHTDHQHGRVLAGAVNLDFLACAAPNGTNVIRFQSQGWPLVEVSLDTLEPVEEEKESTAALVRGMAAQAVKKGYPVSGFDAFAMSEVLPGSGLSSSAACEVLLGVIENHLFCRDELDPVTIAQMGQQAENVFFGKPSGLMDQTASSVGGAVAIDFADPAAPQVRSVEVDLNRLGYALCIIDSGSHADLTDEYAAVPKEMGAVAACFGKTVLREVAEADILREMPVCAGRPVTGRCCGPSTSLPMHRRVGAGGRRPGPGRHGDLPDPGEPVRPLLLGAAPGHYPRRRGGGAGHGGGPGGHRAGPGGAGRLPGPRRRLCRHHPGLCPLRQLEAFRSRVEETLGEGCCHVLSIRPVGGTVLWA